jgi:hypothetical protein
MEIQLHELISWGITIVVTLSAVLSWFHRKKKHSSDYMIIQGLIRGINEHQKYFSIIYTDTINGKMQFSKDLFISVLHSAFWMNMATMQHVLGVIKALGVKKDVPFDAQQFLNPEQQIPKVIDNKTEQKKEPEQQTIPS